MQKKPGNLLRWLLIGLAVGLLVLFARNLLKDPTESGPIEAQYNEFLTSLDKGEVTKVDIRKKGDSLEVIYVVSGVSYETKALAEEYQPLREDLTRKYNINPNLKIGESSMFAKAFGFFIKFLPMIFIVGILFLFLRSVSSNQSRAVKFGQSRGRLFDGSRPAVTFSDVAGVEEAKEELEEVVEFLKNPKKFSALGARIPKGVLLVGPPGCGKTLLAKAVAGEAGVPFFSISGSEFVEMFVGVGASRVRGLFDKARKNSPCIIFIDEIDAVGRHRGAGLGGGHDEREQTLNQLLVEMDGFEPWANIIVIAATNRPDILDPALLRPGRFDRQVVLDHPDVKAREAILEVHLKGKPVSSTIDVSSVAKQTPGFTGAGLANVANEAAILAARREKPQITMEELNEAVDRVISGPERKSRVISTSEKEIIAYHEGGHALVAHLTPGADIPFKISIVARGMAGGFTRFVQQEENRLRSRSEYKAMLITLMGGHAAERLFLGTEGDPELELEVTAGPHSDIEKATYIARQMVMKWGMSKKIGPRSIGKSREGASFLGRDMFEVRDYSEATATLVDEEVGKLLRDAEEKAFELLSQNRARLERLVTVLVEKETIEGEELQRVLESLEESSPQKKEN